MWPRHEAVVRLLLTCVPTHTPTLLQCGHGMKPWCDVETAHEELQSSNEAAMWPRHEAVVRRPLRVREAPSAGRWRPSGAALATLLELRRLHGSRVQRRWSYGSVQAPV
jgi:hypothetical protein